MTDVERSIEEDEDKDEKLLENFASNTSAHGFAHILISKALFMKVVWILVIIGCNVVLYFQLEPMISNYLEKPTKTRISLRDTKSQMFPTVTVCNTNNVLRSKLNELRKTKYFETGNDAVTETNTTSTKPPAVTSGGTTTVAAKGVTTATTIATTTIKKKRKRRGTSTKTVDEGQKDKYDQRSEMLESLSEMAINEKEEVFQYGHQFSDMFLECEWRSFYNCLDMWHPIWHYRLGNCFVFNMEGDGEPAEVAGVHGGLSLKLNINQSEYMDDYMTDTAGIVMQISDPGIQLDPYRDGFSLAPDKAHYIGLTTTNIYRLDPFENNSCVGNQQTNVGKRFFTHEIVKKYSHFTCKDVCIAKKENEMCGCTSYWLPSLNHNRTCIEQHDSQCVDSVMKLFLEGTLDCLKDCNPACEEKKYTIRSSSRNYPTIRMLQNNYKIDFGNVVKVSVSFDSLETHEIIEEKDYDLINLIGGIGGLLGLYNGYSCMTVFEVIILFCTSVFVSMRWLVLKITPDKKVKTNKGYIEK